MTQQSPPDRARPPREAFSSRTVTPKETRAFEEAVARVAAVAMVGREPFSVPVEVEYELGFEGDPTEWPTGSQDGDLDNLLKAVNDAFNGVVFVVLLFVTGQWARIVPTDPYVFHHALSAGIQYLSLDWPTENGWVHYNALQMLSYTLVVFVAAPLAALTGWRMSSWFPTEAKGLNRAFPMEAARKVHFPVMLFFVLFILTHVFLVFFTGALKNLNHMYTSRGDATDAWGLVVFLVSVAVTAAAWFLLRPSFTAPAASKFGTVGR